MSEPEHVHDWCPVERVGLRAIVTDDPLPPASQRNLRWVCPGCGADEPRLLPEAVNALRDRADAAEAQLADLRRQRDDLVEKNANLRRISDRPAAVYWRERALVAEAQLAAAREDGARAFAAWLAGQADAGPYALCIEGEIYEGWQAAGYSEREAMIAAWRVAKTEAR